MVAGPTDAQRNLEVHLVFTADPEKAQAAMRKMASEAQNLDRHTKEAQKSLERMSEVDKAMNGLPVKGQAGYNVLPAQGMSSAAAYAREQIGRASCRERV
jgi:hypothetical protein